MATKVKLMKFLQEVRGLSEMTRRHLTPKPSALFLMQLRYHMTEASQTKRRLSIAIDMKDTAFPHPVKITYLNPTLPKPSRD
jgi:hypothetical protein